MSTTCKQLAWPYTSARTNFFLQTMWLVLKQPLASMCNLPSKTLTAVNIVLSPVQVRAHQVANLWLRHVRDSFPAGWRSVQHPVGRFAALLIYLLEFLGMGRTLILFTRCLLRCTLRVTCLLYRTLYSLLYISHQTSVFRVLHGPLIGNLLLLAQPC